MLDFTDHPTWLVGNAMRRAWDPHHRRIDFTQLQRLIKLLRFTDRRPSIGFTGN